MITLFCRLHPWHFCLQWLLLRLIVLLLFPAAVHYCRMLASERWLTAVVIIRDVMILFGLFLYNYFVERPKPEPSFISKLNTFIQIFFVLFIIASQIIIQPFQFLSILMGSIVFLTSVLSGLDYWITWSKKAKFILTQSG